MRGANIYHHPPILMLSISLSHSTMLDATSVVVAIGTLRPRQIIAIDCMVNSYLTIHNPPPLLYHPHIDYLDVYD